jgi:hypothetical protein
MPTSVGVSLNDVISLFAVDFDTPKTDEQASIFLE